MRLRRATWGDDEKIHSQVFFFSIPESTKDLSNIRVFHPDCGGKQASN